MKTRTSWALAALLLLTLGASSERSCRANAPRRLVVLFTTDEHSQLLAAAPERDDFPLAEVAGTGALKGGVARRAAVFEAERRQAAREGISLVAVSSGDFDMGSLATAAFLTTAPDLVFMKLLGYDAVLTGNHEFDFGPAGLAASIGRAVAQGAAPPLVLTNVAFNGEATLSTLFGERGSGRPLTRSRVIETGSGLRIGIVGVMGVDAAAVAPASAPVSFTGNENPLARPGPAFAAVIAQVQPEITALREVEGVDGVIALLHAGLAKDGTPAGTPEEAKLLAGALSGVDLYLAGHTHASPGRAAWVTDAAGRTVPILQAAQYGAEVGRAELAFPKNGARPVLVEVQDRTRFIPVDDRILPTTDPVILGGLAGMMEGLEGGVKVDGQVVVPSFLEPTLSLVLGEPVKHQTPGDLYFRTIGHTGFDLVGLRPGENPLLDLSADAILASVRGLGLEAEAALQYNGAIWSDLRRGLTGDIGFSDVYRVVPLGIDPADFTPGYPLVRVYLTAAELRAAFELTLPMSAAQTDFFLAPSGLTLTYDPSRPPLSMADPAGPGWIVRMALTGAGGETVLYDAAQSPAWRVNPLSLHPVATTLRVAAFAAAFGLQPRDSAGNPLALGAATVRWPAPIGTSVKEHQAVARYVVGLCAANGGTLPSRYDETSPDAEPRRVICTGAACP